jgi:hypothetical protein
MSPQSAQAVGLEERASQPGDVEVVVHRSGLTRPLIDLLNEIGMPTERSMEEYANQVANLQAAIDGLRADVQRQVDEIRTELGAGEPAEATAAKAKPAQRRR